MLIEAQTLHAQLGDPALRIFDATVVLRVPAEGPREIESGRPGYDEGHVPGAAFADLVDELSDAGSPYDFTIPSAERFAAAAGRLGIGNGTRVVIYAQAPMWATRLWWLLRYFGFDAVSVLDGGLGAWTAAGLPLSTEPVSYPAATFIARPRHELLASTADVEAIAGGDAPACLVNALPAAAFRGEGPRGGLRPGRIPGSVSLPAMRLVDPETGRFRPREQLATDLAAAGALSDERVVAYCGGGIAATVDLFALALVGCDDARLYDGSLNEWGADADRPLQVG